MNYKETAVRLRTPQRNEKQKRNEEQNKSPGEDEEERGRSACGEFGSWGAGVEGGASVRRSISGGGL